MLHALSTRSKLYKLNNFATTKIVTFSSFSAKRTSKAFIDIPNQLIITGFVVSIQICALFQELSLKHAKKERKKLGTQKMLN